MTAAVIIFAIIISLVVLADNAGDHTWMHK